MKQKNSQIEILRGFLILMIIFFHYSFKFTDFFKIKTIQFFSLSDWGTIGVGCFFIITGYFIIPKKMNDFSIKKFLKRKLIRIYPLYLICITIIFVSIRLFGLVGRETSFIEYLLNVIMINGFIGVKYVDGAHWYLTYLLIFYIIVAIQLKYIKKKNIFLFCWLGIKSILKIRFASIPLALKVYKIIGGDYVEFIIIGILLRNLCDIFNRNSPFLENIKTKKIECLLFAIALLQLWGFNENLIFIFIILFIILFLLFISYDLKKLKNIFVPFYFIGNMSYILYLIHQNIGYQLLLCFTKICGDFYIYFILIAFLLVLLLAFIIQLVYDKIFYRYIKRL